MGELVQGVERQPPARVNDGPLERALGRERRNEALERLGQLAPERIGRKELPVVKAGAFAQGEAGQEIATIEVHRLLQRPDAAGTRLG